MGNKLDNFNCYQLDTNYGQPHFLLGQLFFSLIFNIISVYDTIINFDQLFLSKLRNIT